MGRRPSRGLSSPGVGRRSRRCARCSADRCRTAATGAPSTSARCRPTSRTNSARSPATADHRPLAGQRQPLHHRPRAVRPPAVAALRRLSPGLAGGAASADENGAADIEPERLGHLRLTPREVRTKKEELRVATLRRLITKPRRTELTKRSEQTLQPRVGAWCGRASQIGANRAQAASRRAKRRLGPAQHGRRPSLYFFRIS